MSAIHNIPLNTTFASLFPQSWVSIWWALPLAAGLISSFTHCAGMCGPLHLFLSTRAQGRLPMARYHSGRLTGYFLLGTLAGSAGFAVASVERIWHDARFSYSIAAIYLIFGVLMLVGGGRVEKSFGSLFPRRLFNRMAHDSDRGRWLFGGGMLASLLPCPSTFTVLVWSLGLQNPLAAGGAMLLLGLGTLPSFVILSHGKTRRKLVGSSYFQVALGLVLLGLGGFHLFASATSGSAACH